MLFGIEHRAYLILCMLTRKARTMPSATKKSKSQYDEPVAHWVSICGRGSGPPAGYAKNVALEMGRKHAAGATVQEAQTLARHAKPQMTLGVYGRIREERLHQVVEQVAMAVHGETQRVGSVHRGNTAENPRAVNPADAGAYSSSHREGATGCLTAASRQRPHQYAWPE